MPTLSPNLLPGHAADMPLKPPLQAAQPDLFSKMKNRTLKSPFLQPINKGISLDSFAAPAVSFFQNLDNCTDDARSTPKEATSMAYKRVRLPVGKDSSGQPTYRQISGGSEEERFLRGLQEVIRSGRINDYLPDYPSPIAANANPPAKEQHPFTAYAKDFYARYKGHLRANTDVTQRGWLRQQCEFFRDEPIESITVSRIQDYVNSIQANTTDTIHKKITFLREILASAYEDNLIDRNPADSRRINLGGKDGEGIKALPRETVKTLIVKIQNCGNIHIQFFLGCVYTSQVI